MSVAPMVGHRPFWRCRLADGRRIDVATPAGADRDAGASSAIAGASARAGPCWTLAGPVRPDSRLRWPTLGYAGTSAGGPHRERVLPRNSDPSRIYDDPALTDRRGDATGPVALLFLVIVVAAFAAVAYGLVTFLPVAADPTPRPTSAATSVLATAAPTPSPAPSAAPDISPVPATSGSPTRARSPRRPGSHRRPASPEPPPARCRPASPRCHAHVASAVERRHR